MTINFSETGYSAVPGQTLDLTVNFSESVPNGLEGYALELSFPSGLLSINQITVDPLLDFDLFDPGAQRDAGTDFASVAGYVEFGQPAYTGISFATFSVTVDPATPYGQYTLVLGLLNPDADNFVDGTGSVIDDDLIFGSVTLTVGAPPEVDDFAVIRDTDQLIIRFTGIPGLNYPIETSSDLSPDSWTIYTTATAPADGLIEVTAPLPTSGNKRFYRAVIP